MMILIEKRKAADRFGGFSCTHDHFAFMADELCEKSCVFNKIKANDRAKFY